MKDVSLKPDTLRRAVASASLLAPPDAIARLRNGQTAKGDALATARAAGILAAKRTHELIPMCHSLSLARADVAFHLRDDRVDIEAEALALAPTGVEMEALTAASVAALTLYDMLKPHADPAGLRVTDLQLRKKTGGKSQFPARLQHPLAASVIVLSDTVAAGRKPDTAGRAVEAALLAAGFAPVTYAVLPDEPAQLEARIKAEVAQGVAAIFAVGGTGLSPRDRTVETVEPLLTAPLPGMMEAARSFGQRRTPYAMLSRGVAGFAGSSLVATLPGSRRGAEESVAALLPGLLHVLHVFRGARHTGGYGEAGG